MTLALLILSSVILIIAFKRLQIVELSSQVLVDSRRAVQLIGDASLDDDHKEREVQRLGLSMFAYFGKIIVRLAAAALLPTLALVVMVAVGVTDTAGLAHWAASWTFLVINLVLFGAAFLIHGRT
ncbi:MAG: hypothetical protein ACR2OV_14315 [Hyphomicrobiaceae bacterium]